MKPIEYAVERKVDGVGRLVLPRDLRKQYGIPDGGTVYLVPMEDGILLKIKEEKR